MAAQERKWWKHGVVYQIYPASFKDSNGDGLGDVPGIISKLDYIRDLGVDVIWVSPIYDSPQVDMGYDIRDYEAVYPPYGTVDDVMTLINETHARGMRILMDLVINHTSDQHAWFKESRSSKDSPKRDWYIWRPARKDENGNRLPPNNWRSNFSQSAWTWDEITQEYYLHLFCSEQPDLNWENSVTRKAIYDSAIEFWLKRGVDGFRIDTVNMYSKGDLADVEVVDPSVYHQPAFHKFCNGPRMHEFLREMNDKVFSKYGDVMTVGECPITRTAEEILGYVSASDPQLSMLFQFDIVDVGTGLLHGRPKFEYTPWSLPLFKKLWTQLQKVVDGTDGWATAFLENHDQGRSVSRFATDAPAYRGLGAKMLATMLVALSGTLFVYQGQEIGMINAPSSWELDQYTDVDSANYIQFIKDTEGDDPQVLERVRKGLQVLGRENSRLPMQWDKTRFAGFTTGNTGKPWMPVHDLYAEINVQQQQGDPDSVLNYWKKMLKLRKENADTFVYGQFQPLQLEDESTFMYLKQGQNSAMALVVLNFTGDEKPFLVHEPLGENMNCIACNYRGSPTVQEQLRPWEARIYIKT